MLAMLLLRRLHKFVLKTSHLAKKIHLWRHSDRSTAILSTTQMTVISGNRNFTGQLNLNHFPPQYTLFVCTALSLDKDKHLLQTRLACM